MRSNRFRDVPTEIDSQVDARASTRGKLRYPTKARIVAAVRVARELGLVVSGFEISRCGAIRVFESEPVTPSSTGDFERYEGQL
jgi:hypothetical protein